jgi:hypothetical protein
MEGALIKHFQYICQKSILGDFFFLHRNASTCQYFVFISGRKFMYMLDSTLENTVLSVFESGED